MCKVCGRIFVEGDQRTNEGVIVKKVMCTMLYFLGKVSFNMLVRIFDTWFSLVYRWIVEAGVKMVRTEFSGEIKAMLVW
ncbi:MAG: hypothetical protein FWH37_03660 [Candidatus Bathyarchaeota archaeon]|nr:hypothetical protein [Candidatus Termiticorpusculum sp.]